MPRSGAGGNGVVLGCNVRRVRLRSYFRCNHNHDPRRDHHRSRNNDSSGDDNDGGDNDFNDNLLL